MTGEDTCAYQGSEGHIKFLSDFFSKSEIHLGSIRHWENVAVGIKQALLFFSHLTMFVFNSLFNNVTEKKLCEKNKVLMVYSFIHFCRIILVVGPSCLLIHGHGGSPNVCLFSWPYDKTMCDSHHRTLNLKTLA